MQSKGNPTTTVFFTFKQMGQLVRVEAIDEATGIEVIVSAPATLSKTDMQTLAYNKLQFVLAKRGKTSQ